MLLIHKIEIKKFVCFDHVEISPSVNPEKPLTIIRAENGSGKTTFLRAIRWCMYGEDGLPDDASRYPLQPADWSADQDDDVCTSVSITFATDGSTRHDDASKRYKTKYILKRSVTTIGQKSTDKNGVDFRRINEEISLMAESPTRDGWHEESAGVNSILAALLPWELRDFFVMDADEATDFVGGVEGKVLKKSEVVAKTTHAIRSLLGLSMFEDASKRIKKIGNNFSKEATKATNSADLKSLEAKLTEVTEEEERLKGDIDTGTDNLNDLQAREKKAEQEEKDAEVNLHDSEPTKERIKSLNLAKRHAQDEVETCYHSLATSLSDEMLLASLARKQITKVQNELQPLYEDGTIPARHLAYVEKLLQSGECVCGQDISDDNEYRIRVKNTLEQSKSTKETANLLADILQWTKEAEKSKDGSTWDEKCDEWEEKVEKYVEEISAAGNELRDLESLLDKTDLEKIEIIRQKKEALSTKIGTLQKEIVRAECRLESTTKEKKRHAAKLKLGQKKFNEAAEYLAHEKTAAAFAIILDAAQESIREGQVQDLEKEMNRLFFMMIANVKNNETDANLESNIAPHMIAKVGIRPVDEGSKDYEIYALHDKGWSMPPTAINGASRRTLALSFVLAVCKESNTKAPLVADSLLNFMSGIVRTNSFRVTCETSSQPILLLTGSDLESNEEAQLAERFAGKTYTLTGQWQHVGVGGDVVNLSDSRRVSIMCECGPREYCDKCERVGQAARKDFVKKH